MQSIKYCGNGPYCWSNSASMLLSSIGEDISPTLIDVLGGVGLGAFVVKDMNVTFFSGFSGLPDIGISKALEILGFEYTESAKDDGDGAPWGELSEVLQKGPAILGPLDMGHLVYRPSHKEDHGIDHYVLAIELSDEEMKVHDPAGFPYVLIDKSDMEKSWKAEKIVYRRGYYRYWAAPNRVETPSEEEVFNRAMEWFKEIYVDGEKFAKKKNRIVDVEAINHLVDIVKKDKLSEKEWGMLTGFAFPLGARRANDFSRFFEGWDDELSKLKLEQAKLFGECHSFAVAGDREKLWKGIEKLSDVEREIKERVIEKK